MAKSNVFMNVSDVTFTYGSGTPTVVTLVEVTDVQTDESSDVKEWSADAAPGPTAKKLVNRRRVARVMGADIATLRSIPEGVEGTLQWTERDLDNEDGTGAYVCTLAHCSRNGSKWGGKHNDFKEVEGEFSAIWTKAGSDYVDPLSCAQTA